MIVCGISTGFPVLFPTPAQITYVLLTRAPLYSGSCPPFLARLACVRHAASVRSEPGSNSPVELEHPRSRADVHELKCDARHLASTKIRAVQIHCVGTLFRTSKVWERGATI